MTDILEATSHGYIHISRNMVMQPVWHFAPNEEAVFLFDKSMSVIVMVTCLQTRTVIHAKIFITRK